MPGPIAGRYNHQAVELLAEIARRIVAASDPEMSDHPRPEAPPTWLQRACSDLALAALREQLGRLHGLLQHTTGASACPAPKQHPERGAGGDRPGTCGRLVPGGVRSPLVFRGLEPAGKQCAQRTNLRLSALVPDRLGVLRRDRGPTDRRPGSESQLLLTRLVVRSTMHPAIFCSHTFQRGCLNSIPMRVDGESQALHTSPFQTALNTFQIAFRLTTAA